MDPNAPLCPPSSHLAPSPVLPWGMGILHRAGLEGMGHNSDRKTTKGCTGGVVDNKKSQQSTSMLQDEHSAFAILSSPPSRPVSFLTPFERDGS